LCAVAGLVAFLGQGVNLLHAAALLAFIKEHSFLGQSGGSIDTGATVATEGRSSIDDDIIAFAIKNTGVRD
jgi:hypothetical protein